MISWIPEEASAISTIHSEDDILQYMQSFSKSFFKSMEACVAHRSIAEKMAALDTSIDRCESDIATANNNIRLLGQKQTVIHQQQAREESVSGKGLESRLALLPADMRDYSSIPLESDEEIIRKASHITIHTPETQSYLNATMESPSSDSQSTLHSQRPPPLVIPAVSDDSVHSSVSDASISSDRARKQPPPVPAMSPDVSMRSSPSEASISEPTRKQPPPSVPAATRSLMSSLMSEVRASGGRVRENTPASRRSVMPPPLPPAPSPTLARDGVEEGRIPEESTQREEEEVVQEIEAAIRRSSLEGSHSTAIKERLSSEGMSRSPAVAVPPPPPSSVPPSSFLPSTVPPSSSLPSSVPSPPTTIPPSSPSTLPPPPSTIPPPPDTLPPSPGDGSVHVTRRSGRPGSPLGMRSSRKIPPPPVMPPPPAVRTSAGMPPKGRAPPPPPSSLPGSLSSTSSERTGTSGEQTPSEPSDVRFNLKDQRRSEGKGKKLFGDSENKQQDLKNKRRNLARSMLD